MKEVIRRLTMTGCTLGALAIAGCSRAPEGWTPVLEESSTTFLKTETEAVASRVRSARSHLPANPEDAAVDLVAAEDGLGHLLREMEEPLERLEDARAALEGDTAAAREALQALATRLNLASLEGRLGAGRLNATGGRSRASTLACSP